MSLGYDGGEVLLFVYSLFHSLSTGALLSKKGVTHPKQKATALGEAAQPFLSQSRIGLPFAGERGLERNRTRT